jgi:serine O-acetyltransferase
MLATIKEDLNAVMTRDPAARSRLEVVLCYAGFHAVLLHRLNHMVWKLGFRLFARWLAHVTRWLTGVEIHPAVVIGKGFFIDHGMGVVIGETAKIGDNVTLFQGVTLGGVSMDRGAIRHPQLGDDVVVGAGAKVLGAITLANGARVGANAVVVKSVEEGVTVVGIPAQPVKPNTPQKAEPSSEAASLEVEKPVATTKSTKPKTTKKTSSTTKIKKSVEDNV